MGLLWIRGTQCSVIYAQVFDVASIWSLELNDRESEIGKLPLSDRESVLPVGSLGVDH
jgi:hypothetical protein